MIWQGTRKTTGETPAPHEGHSTGETPVPQEGSEYGGAGPAGSTRVDSHMGVRFTPLMIALLMAWILCVCVHEFAHALVAYFGGDRSVREKGYLSLDPTRFIDPVFSLLIPAIVLMLGGLPLPGGAVRIDESALRSRRWSLYVSAAGPASNFLLFLLFGLALHPALGLVKPTDGLHPSWVYFVGAMAYLNFVATLFNLIPVPPLDGYRLIEHRLSPETQWKLRQPQVAMMAFGALFMLFWVVPHVWIAFDIMLFLVTGALGLPDDLMHQGFLFVVHGIAPDGA
jgi:Zn-dependent protease